MPTSIRNLKTRVRSVKNTKQITRAMQMVAASKMRRSEEADRVSAPYVKAASELLTYLSNQGITKHHILYEEREVRNRLLIVIAADKGLAGAYNANIFKQYVTELRKDDEAHIKNSTVAIGRRVAQFVTRLKDTTVLGVYQDLPDQPNQGELTAILDTAMKQFRDRTIDAVDLIYTQFHSTISQNVVVKRILPAGFEETEVSAEVRQANYEPNEEAVLDGATYRLVGAQIFQALLDARASEHAMRMLAMKNATDNANELVGDLTLEMNKARQGAITQELAEISGGVEAMNG